jgi:hypothetical protein
MPLSPGHSLQFLMFRAPCTHAVEGRAG